MLDHLSIQCADAAASATFYDAALPRLGGRRVMDFGEVIGFGVPPRPEFWIGPRTCPCRKSHPCSSCRMLVLMKYPAESVASSYVKAGDLVRSHERRGQWLERAGVRDALMRPVPVAGLLELPQGVQKVGLVPDQRAVQ
jgi:hypothetical protein